MARTDRSSEAAIRADLEEFWKGFSFPPDRRAHWEFASRRYQPILDFLATSPPGPDSRVLDLGGGLGGLAVALHARYGGHYDLADGVPPPEGTEAHLARYGIESFRAVRFDRPETFEALPGGYDLVLFVEVLEHLLQDPLPVFRRIHDQLRPNGRLLLTTPNLARLGNRWKLLRGKTVNESGRFPQDGSLSFGHVIEYTLDELDYLLGWESFVRERSRVVQHVPNAHPTRFQLAGVPWLNTVLADRLRLGDDLVALYRPVARPEPPRPRPGRI